MLTLRRHFPGAIVTLLVRAEYERLAALALPDVKVIGLSGTPLPRAVQAIRAAHAASADLACSLGPGRLNALAVLSSGAPRLAGYLEGSPANVPFLRRNPVETFGIAGSTPAEYFHEPLAARALKVCEALGITDTVSPFPLRVGRYGAARPAPGDPPVVVLHPFAGWSGRAYPTAALAEVVRRILDSTASRIELIATAKDGERLNRLQEILGSEPRLSACVSGDLLEIAYHMTKADLFVGTDSGPLHLAASLCVPSIGLYGPAEPGLTRPYAAREDRFTTLFHRLDCSPCDQVECTRPGDSCMLRVTADELVHAVLARLSDTPAEAPHG